MEGKPVAVDARATWYADDPSGGLSRRARVAGAVLLALAVALVLAFGGNGAVGRSPARVPVAHGRIAGLDAPAVATPARAAGLVPIPGERPAILARATPLDTRASVRRLTVTVVLRRRDQVGFERFLAAVQNRHSPLFRHFLSQTQLTARFGPTAGAYAAVTSFLSGRGLHLQIGSANRLTITASGTRAQIERALSVRIGEYELDGHDFSANTEAPALPAGLAMHVAAIVGLSSIEHPLAPQPQIQQVTAAAFTPPNADDLYEEGLLAKTCLLAEKLENPAERLEALSELLEKTGVTLEGSPVLLSLALTLYKDAINYRCAADELNLVAAYAANPEDEDEGEEGDVRAAAKRAIEPSAVAAGVGQKIGLLEFANYHASDVSEFLALDELEPSEIDDLSEDDIAGGAGPAQGPGESEALLDIDAALTLAPGAKVVVYDTAFNGGASFQTMFNAMVNDGDTVISNSWSECENQVSLADVQSIDEVLANAAASGVTVLNGTGDSGSTCLDGSPDTVGVPADSPHATAIGGSSAVPGPLGSYGSESWWNGSEAVPATGQGGFGTSRFFARPSYQEGFTSATGRSVPDIVVNADPAQGYEICQADAGGCPDGLEYGGTSAATPIMAALVADINAKLGHDLGELNPVIYPLAGTTAFHSAAALGSDFEHVGLGSPDLDSLYLQLAGASPGPVDASTSDLVGEPVAGVTVGAQDTLVAQLLDQEGNSIAGKHVTLSANAGSHATIGSPSGTSSIDNGTVAWQVSDPEPETVTFTATDTDDDVALEPVKVTFVPPPASAGAVEATPTEVAANGTSSSTITVTLHDAEGKPVSGKTVTLDADADAHATIKGPTPLATNADGQVTFTVTDPVQEAVTFTATDVTDGNLPLPQTASVTFSSAPGKETNCDATGPPEALNGYAFSSYATGFPEDFPEFGCVGPIGLAFDSAGNLYVMDPADNTLYKFPPGGGVADALTEVGQLPEEEEHNYIGSAFGLAFGADGNLYATTKGSYWEGQGGSVLQVSPSTGQIVRVLERVDAAPPNTECAIGLATDPLSGDLFFTQPHCAIFAEEPWVSRIANPYGDSPELSHYATVGYVDGISFGPDGTIYLANEDGKIVSVTPTDGPQPPTVSTVANLLDAEGNPAPVDGVAVGTTPGSKTASYLIVNRNDGIVTLLSNLSSPTPTQTEIYKGGSRGDFVTVGPEGCIYATQSDRIIRITKADGSCGLAQTSVLPKLGLTPSVVSSALTQGSSETFTASLSNVPDPAGTPVTFSVKGTNATLGLADANAQGQATFTYTGELPGVDAVSATATAQDTTLRSNEVSVTWVAGAHPTELDLNLSPAGGAQQTPTQVTAKLYDASTFPPTPLGGKPVALAVGEARCEARTDASGTASCSLTPSGSDAQTLTATFAGDGADGPSGASQPFVIDLRPTALTYGGEASAIVGSPVTLAAQLTLAGGGAALPGEPVSLTLGTGAGAQACEAITDGSGTASCTVSDVTQTVGTAPVEAVFAGDDANAASLASSSVRVSPAVALLSPPPGPSPAGRLGAVLSSKLSTPPAPALATVLGLPSARQCLSRRVLLVHVHAPAGQKLLSVTLTLGRKLLRSVRFTKGKDDKIPSTLVDLRGLPKGTFTLRIVVTTVSGKIYRASRTYHTCVAGHSHNGKTGKG